MASPASTAGRRPWLAAFAAINALAAGGGAVSLILGLASFGEVIDDRLPFKSLVLAGFALGVLVALPLTVLAWAAWTASSRTDVVALMVGALLIGWIVMQVVVLRAYSPFQPIYLAVGVSLVVASHRARLSTVQRGLLAVPVGAVAIAVGVGLLPHLVKTGLAAKSVVSVLLLLIGIAAVVLGVGWVVRGRRLIGRIATVLAALLTVAVTASIVAPAVAVTNVPRAEVVATPASRGLAFESATLTTSDEVQLAAWFVRGTNRAGVVLLHGAGSTRSAVLDHAAALVDARGHGGSGGVAMDFGWYGDLDVVAATDFLAGQTGIDASRIGVVGMSMGGEEAIGAAAADSRIRAVVAEGATARSAADKAWLSDAYGWRGWVQEQLERVQDQVTGYLSTASPPTALRDSVADASDAHFLLITAGNVDDEGRAAQHIRAAAEDRVTVWTIEGVGHTGGYEADGEEWQRRVVEFLDEHLLG